ncbi:MAG: branched-chain amino acid ABC transporter permease [Firmicutes bacterium]|nr:branched-chain amino acid ABC transporter permease [Bacillota bacterium]
MGISILGMVVVWGVVQWLSQSGVLNLFITQTLVIMGINVILAVSLNLITGVTGQLVLGHAAFMGLGCYFAAILTYKMGLPFPVGLIGGGLVAGLGGLVIGLPTLRLRGDYLAIATLGFGEILRIVYQNWDYVGGAVGMSPPQLANWTWVFWLAVLSVLIIWHLVDSSHGRALQAIRENEIAAEAVGVATTRHKVTAFIIGAFFAGIAGGLYGFYNYAFQPSSFDFLHSFNILVLVVLGGLGSITGSIVGAVVVTALQAALQSYPYIQNVIFALLLILMMLFRRQGLLGRYEFHLSMIFPGLRREEKGGHSDGARS